MTRRSRYSMLTAAILLAVAATTPLAAQPGEAVGIFRAFEEVPALSFPGGGKFKATINEDGSEVTWDMNYTRMTGNVTQAHLHFGQTGVNGGISVFLCTNLGNGPAGTQACPTDDGHLTGTIHAGDVIGPAGQGIAASQLTELLRAIRAGIVYANVHTDQFPGGEIRGQLLFTPAPGLSLAGEEP